MADIKRIVITPGEPAGIGPDITIQIAQKDWPVELVVIADPNLLLERAKQINLPLQLSECDLQTDGGHQPGTLKVIPISLSATAEAGKLNPANAAYVIKTLAAANALCQEQKASAIVTGPVHKGVINKAGIQFTGHTEFFAAQSGVKQTVMLFVVNELKVALVTTHLPLSKVSQAITTERLEGTLVILINELKTRFHIPSPRVLVCGLNPHAGEGGYLGHEEIEIITPILNNLRQKNANVLGPLPADTIFTPKQLNQADAILAMYHDQALPLIKYIGFGNAVNVTLGLPYIRTSVDHGTALDIAATKQADSSSLESAIALAIQLIFNV